MTILTERIVPLTTTSSITSESLLPKNSIYTRTSIKLSITVTFEPFTSDVTFNQLLPLRRFIRKQYETSVITFSIVSSPDAIYIHLSFRRGLVIKCSVKRVYGSSNSRLPKSIQCDFVNPDKI